MSNCLRKFFQLVSAQNRLLLFLIIFSRTVQATSQPYRLPHTGFIENKGQILNQDYRSNQDVLFLFTGRGFNIQLRKSGYSFEVVNREDASTEFATKNKWSPENLKKMTSAKINISRVDVEFSGHSPTMAISGEKKSADYLNYITAGQSFSEVHYFGQVLYKNVYPKTDIEFFITPEETFKYNIILHPGADLKAIKFLVSGASHIELQNNKIVYSTSIGELTERIPASYYADTKSTDAGIHFALKDNCISFTGPQDNTQTLVIDPSSNRIWGTYYGDTGNELCNGVGTDSLNNIYIAGYTFSTNNIATNGTYQSTLTGSYDIYLAKFDPTGARVWGTYFGGSSVEAAYGLYVEKNGNVYVCGDTFSTSNVSSPGAHQTSYGGGIDDALLIKFNSAGQRIWSTYFGGTLHDIASAVTVDKKGNVIICGHSESANAIATVGSFNETQAGSFDVFVAKFDSAGTQLWGTYFGDTGTEEAWALDCDQQQNVFVTGFTTSTSNIASSGTYQTVFAGIQDAFIAKFNSNGTQVLFSTYYGGPGSDQGTGLKIDNVTGNIIVAGNTNSTTGITTVNSYQQTIGSAEDGFIISMDPSGSSRQWGTYLGGNGSDYIYDMKQDAAGNILVCGSSLSTNAISSVGAYQPALAATNTYDAYIARYGLNGNKKNGTYFGGSGNDEARCMATDRTGKIFITGNTSSTNNIASPGAHLTAEAGSGDAFLAAFCLAPEPIITHAGSDTVCKGKRLLLSTQNFPAYLWNDGSVGSSTQTDSALLPGIYYYAVTVSDGFGCTGKDSSKVVVDVCTGVESIKEELGLKIYPVPTNDLLLVELNKFTGEKIEVEVYSADGKIVQRCSRNEKQFSIDFRQLPVGFFLLKITRGDKIQYRHVVHQ